MIFKKKFLLLYILSITIFTGMVYTIGKEDLNSIYSTLINTNYFLIILAFIILLLNFTLNSIILKYILRRIKENVSLTDSFRIITSSFFVSSLFPSQIGSIYRFFVLKKILKIKTHKSAIAVSMDIFIGFFITFLVGLIGILMIFLYNPKLNFIIYLIPILICISVITILFLILKSRRFSYLLSKSFNKKVREFIKNFNEGLNIYDKKDIYFISISYFMSSFITATILFILGVSIGVDIPFLAIIFIAPLIFIINLLPIHVGGFGTTELSLVFFLTQLGVNPISALTIAILNRIVLILGIIFGAFNLMKIGFPKKL